MEIMALNEADKIPTIAVIGLGKFELPSFILGPTPKNDQKT
jgi:hypothetical protein